MDDLPGLLAGDYGFRHQDKLAPMSASKSAFIGSGSASTRLANPLVFDDVFGGPPKYPNSSSFADTQFVRFVSTPEILERVSTIELEIIQIEEAITVQCKRILD